MNYFIANPKDDEERRFIEESNRLLEKIPEVARERVAAKAWQDGHSCGLSEVLMHLEELVDLFEGVSNI